MRCGRYVIAAWFLLAWLGLLESPAGGGRTASAWASDGTLRFEVPSEVRVDRKRVCLLDLFPDLTVPPNIQELLAKTDIGEAPGVGAEKVIQRDQLKAYLVRLLSPHGFEPSNIDLRAADRITIRRESVQVTQEQIEALYRDFITAQAPWDPGDIVVRGVSFSGPTVELPAGSISHEVVANPTERFLGNVVVTIHFSVDGERERSVRASGKVDVLQDVVHAARAIRRNEVIQASDVEMQRVNIAEKPDRYANRMEQVVGKRMLRAVGFHQPIALADMDQPLTLKRGSAVTILYESPGLRLAAKGQAREDGSTGDSIRVLNITTNKTVLCRIIDETTVRALP